MRCLIVDDEPLAHRVIRNYCEALSHIEIADSAYSAFEAMKILNEKAIDLIFLDINMPKLQGLDFLKTLTSPPLVIVTTAYQEFAVESYEQQVIDYLLKPFSLDRFLKAVNRAQEQKQLFDKGKPVIQTASLIPGSQQSQSETLFVKGDKRVHQVKMKDIEYLESYGSYVKIHIGGEVIITLDRLANYESKFAKQGFIRIHKSYLVPISRISVIEGNELQVGEQKLPIGSVYRHNVSSLFK